MHEDAVNDWRGAMPLTRLGACVRCGSPRGAKVFYCTRITLDHDPDSAKEFAKIVCDKCIHRHMLAFGAISSLFFSLAMVAVVFSGALVVKGEPIITWFTVGLIAVLFAAVGGALLWRHCFHAGSSIVIHFLQRNDEHPSPYHYELGRGKVVVGSPKPNEEATSTNGGKPVASL